MIREIFIFIRFYESIFSITTRVFSEGRAKKQNIEFAAQAYC